MKKAGKIGFSLLALTILALPAFDCHSVARASEAYLWFESPFVEGFQADLSLACSTLRLSPFASKICHR